MTLGAVILDPIKRATVWGLRRMATGDMLAKALSDDELATEGVTSGDMALRVQHLGRYGQDAAAKNAGFRQADILDSFDDKSNHQRETDVLSHALIDHRPNER